MTEEHEAINESMDKLLMKSCKDEQYRQIQLMSYKAGYYAAVSQMIIRLMEIQGEKIRTPYDQP